MTGNNHVAVVSVLLLVCAVGVGAVAARSLQNPRAVAGFHVLGVPGGGVTCEEMTNNLRTDRQSWGVLYGTYVTGFITGANFVSYVANGRNSNVGSDIPSETIFGSVEQYCRQNLSKNIHQAVEGVYSQLAAR